MSIVFSRLSVVRECSASRRARSSSNRYATRSASDRSPAIVISCPRTNMDVENEDSISFRSSSRCPSRLTMSWRPGTRIFTSVVLWATGLVVPAFILRSRGLREWSRASPSISGAPAASKTSSGADSAKGLPSDEVHVQVEDRLPCVATHVEDHPVPRLCDPLGRRDLVGHLEHLDQKVPVGGLEVANVSDVPLRNNQDMNGSCRRDVSECVDVLTIENRRARDLSRDDLAEQTVVGHRERYALGELMRAQPELFESRRQDVRRRVQHCRERAHVVGSHGQDLAVEVSARHLDHVHVTTENGSFRRVHRVKLCEIDAHPAIALARRLERDHCRVRLREQTIDGHAVELRESLQPWDRDAPFAPFVRSEHRSLELLGRSLFHVVKGEPLLKTDATKPLANACGVIGVHRSPSRVPPPAPCSGHHRPQANGTVTPTQSVPQSPSGLAFLSLCPIRDGMAGHPALRRRSRAFYPSRS